MKTNQSIIEIDRRDRCHLIVTPIVIRKRRFNQSLTKARTNEFDDLLQPPTHNSHHNGNDSFHQLVRCLDRIEIDCQNHQRILNDRLFRFRNQLALYHHHRNRSQQFSNHRNNSSLQNEQILLKILSNLRSNTVAINSIKAKLDCFQSKDERMTKFEQIDNHFEETDNDNSVVERRKNSLIKISFPLKKSSQFLEEFDSNTTAVLNDFSIEKIRAKDCFFSQQDSIRYENFIRFENDDYNRFDSITNKRSYRNPRIRKILYDSLSSLNYYYQLDERDKIPSEISWIFS